MRTAGLYTRIYDFPFTYFRIDIFKKWQPHDLNNAAHMHTQQHTCMYVSNECGQ